MIRFAVVASVVSAAVALLVIGALSGDLALVYISIGLAALALAMLVVGVAVWRDQVFAGTTPARGPQAAADQHARAYPSPAPAGVVHAGPIQAGPVQASRPASAEDARARPAVASGWPAGPAREPVASSAGALPEHDRPAGRERRDRQRTGRQRGPGGQRPAAAGPAGRQHDTAAADWEGPEDAAAGWHGHAAAPEERPGREAGPFAGRAPRRPASAEQPEPADDPTRLAHRLGIGRQASADTDFPAPAARPAGSSGGRARKPDTTAGDKEPAPLASGPATTERAEAPAAPAPPATPVRETGDATPAGRTASEAAPGAAGASAAGTAGAAEPAPAAADNGARPAEGASAPADAQVLVVPGIARYHKADCILIRFLGEDDLQRMSRQQAEEAGCAACRACRP